MNYVGKPLAYILATPGDDDARQSAAVAFGSRANDQDIEEFSTPLRSPGRGAALARPAVIVIRRPGTPPGSIVRGAHEVAVYSGETVTECAVARFDAQSPTPMKP